MNLSLFINLSRGVISKLRKRIFFETQPKWNLIKPCPLLFLKALYCLTLALLFSGTSFGMMQSVEQEDNSRPNIVIITADDMTYNSLGIMGNPMDNITPNIDEFAEQGILFTRGYVTTPVCGPSRESILTGLYPEHHGVMGHAEQPPTWWKQPQKELTGLLKWLGQHGYYTGVIDKHTSRYSEGSIDYTKTTAATALGRDPEKFFSLTQEFIEKANRAGKSFVLNVNAVDPHEYWAGAPNETNSWIEAMFEAVGAEKEELTRYPNGKFWPDPKEMYGPEEVMVPAPYPDTPEFREWLTYYYGSVNRLDQVVGRTLDALGEKGAENTIVIFLSDHGLGWAFSKWSMYPHGTRTPIIVKWPEKIKPGQLDATHLLSTVDIMPTLLDAVGVPVPYELDGNSFLSLMTEEGGKWPRETVFTTWNFMDRGQRGDPVYNEYRADLPQKTQEYRPMRALHGQRYLYVWNAWADGETKIPVVMGGEGSTAISLLSKMETAVPLYPDPAERVEFYLFRAPEELYDIENDPGCLNNLAEDRVYQSVLKRFRRDMLKTLESNMDHELTNYRTHLDRVSASQGTGNN